MTGARAAPEQHGRLGHEPSHLVHAFDNAQAPIVRIPPGTSLDFYCPDSTLAPDYERSGIVAAGPHTIVGPVAIEGAEPGDALIIDIVDVAPAASFGHCVITPGGGLLPDRFSARYVHRFEIDSSGFTFLRPGVRLPVQPFLGLMGVAAGEHGALSTGPPRRIGGNMDNRELIAGSRLWLPVEVPEALFWCGDGHALQGDGEVCGMGLETALYATLRFDLEKGAAPAAPCYLSSRPAAGPTSYYSTTWAGPDMYSSSQRAIELMIDHLVAQRGLSAEEAYVLCSLAVDLRIAEVVDSPNWLVAARLPLDLFA